MSAPGLPHQAFILGSMVLEMAVLTSVGLILGAIIDRRLGTGPLLLVLLTFAGFIGGIYRIIRILKLMESRNDPPPPHPG